MPVVSIEDNFEVGITSEKLYIVVDTDGFYVGINGNLEPGTDFDLSDFKLKSITTGLDGTVGTMDFEITGLKFGDHIASYGIPIKILSGDAENATDNVVIRGFLMKEDAQLDTGNDSVSATAFDFKWLMSRCGNIHGRFYSSDYFDPVIDTSREFDDLRSAEKFRYAINYGGYNNGYIYEDRTVFNEDGEPNAMTPNYGASDIMFAQRPIKKSSGLINQIFGAYYWNYAQIISYIFKFWIKPYIAQDKIILTGLESIESFPKDIVGVFPNVTEEIPELIQPVNFDIDSVNPLDALNKTVQAIPGDWHWDIVYHPDVIEIKIINETRDMGQLGKVLIIGSNEKLALEDNTANVETISVTRDASDSSSHGVVRGGAIRIETTLELYPAWTRYLRKIGSRDRNNRDYTVEYVGQSFDPLVYFISDFISDGEFRAWLRYVSDRSESDNFDEIVTNRFDQMFRVYRTDPLYEEFDTHESNVRLQSAYRYGSGLFPGKVSPYYTGLTSDNLLVRTILRHIDKDRNIGPPETDMSVVSGGVTDKVSQDKSADNSLNGNPFVFIREKYSSRSSEKWFLADRDKIGYSFSDNNTRVSFDKPQINISPAWYSIRADLGNDDVISEFLMNASESARLTKQLSRNIFMTCTVWSDVPFLMDTLDQHRINMYNNLDLVDYSTNDEHITFRVGSILPAPKGYNGQAVSYDEEDGIRISTYIEDTDSPFADWSLLVKTGNAGVVHLFNKMVTDTTPTLLQAIIDMIDSTAPYKQDINATLGRLDLNYKNGDMITDIINSETENEGSGYFNMQVYISGITIANNGEDSYNMSLSITNKSGRNSVNQAIRSK